MSDETEQAGVLDPEGRREYLELRKNLDTVAQEAAKSFDQTVLTLAGGALVLSITFIKEIAPSPASGTSGVLYVGWAGFVLSILSTLVSFSGTQMAIRHRMHELDCRYYPSLAGSPPRRPWAWVACLLNLSADDPWGDLVDVLNRCSTWTFFAGAGLTLVFCACNINWRSP